MSLILLIEPDRVLAKTYETALKRAGHKLKVVTNSQDAIYCSDEVCPEAVVLEIQLVGHSGIEFLYEFRSYPEWQNIPVLMHTNVPYGELEDSWAILSGQLGVDAYKYKPLTSLNSLVAAVNDLTNVSLRE